MDPREPIEVTIPPLGLGGSYAPPEPGAGVVVFAHGSGNSRFSPRNRHVAAGLRKARLGTLLLDLLRPEEANDRRKVFDIPLLAQRLMNATDTVTSSAGAGGAVPAATSALPPAPARRWSRRRCTPIRCARWSRAAAART
jgi:hypothetical protein